MLIFVSEYICGGGCGSDERDRSLAAEGRAMLLAAVEDFAKLDDCRVVTTWDSRLGEFPRQRPNISVENVTAPSAENAVFSQLAARADTTFVIAPEFDQILANRRSLVDAAGGKFLGPSISAIRLSSDKLLTSEHCRRHRIAHVPTASCTSPLADPVFDFPLVVKPRYGAGSIDTHWISDLDEWQAFLGTATQAPCQMVQQPYVAGLAVSTAALVPRHCKRIDVFPVGLQRIRQRSRLKYEGGRIPARLAQSTQRAILQTVERTLDSLPGLVGYVGFDLIVPTSRPEEPLLVDVNPRMTTSYLGYRQLTDEKLCARLLHPIPIAIPWRNHTVEIVGSRAFPARLPAMGHGD